MHHCPKCESNAITLDAHVDGVREYSCIQCQHTWETVEVPREYMLDLLQRSLHLSVLQKTP